MEDFISLIVVFIVYLVAAISGAKKKKKQKRSAERAFSQIKREKRRHKREKPTGDAVMAQMQELLDEAAQVIQKTPLRNERTECHDTPRMHLHEATQEQMHAAKEGEDPCHAGGTQVQDSSLNNRDTEDDGRAIAREVLRGVVMSEILARPCERRTMYRNRRSM